MRFRSTDEEWAELEPLMPAKRKSARVDDRRVVNAIHHALGPPRSRAAYAPATILWIR